MWITRLALSTLTLITVSGCAQIANFYDRQDPCQTRAELGRAVDYKMPSWCGASLGRTYIYNNQGQRQGYIK